MELSMFELPRVNCIKYVGMETKKKKIQQFQSIIKMAMCIIHFYNYTMML